MAGGQRPPVPPAPPQRQSSVSTYRLAKLLWAALVTGLLVGTSTVQILWPTSPWLDVLQEMKEATGIEPESHPRGVAPAIAPQGPAVR
jgi:hypothetical protein